MQPTRHILITSSWFPTDKATSGIFVREQAEALARAGHKVLMLRVSYATLGSRLRNIFRTVPVTDPGNVVAMLGVNVLFWLPARFRRNPQQHFKKRILQQVTRAMDAYARRQGKPDLIHHHSLSDNAYVAAHLAQHWKIPYVFTEHSNYVSDAELNKFNRFETFEDRKRFLEHASARIAVSNIRAAVYPKIYGTPFICIPNLVSTLFEQPLQPRPEAPFTFICVANLDKNKRQDLLVAAFAKGFGGNTAYRLLLVGSGPMETNYRAVVRQEGLEEQVIFTGKKSRVELVTLFDQSHVGMLVSDRETFGIVLAEAMFRGLPVIATASGGPEEVVTEECGLLCPPGDETQLLRAMQQLAAQYSLYSPERIRQSAISRFSERAVVAQLENVYTAALNTLEVKR